MLWSIICIFIINTSIYASSYGPGIIFHKPYSTAPYFSLFCMSFAYGKTLQGYNHHGKTVPFLQEYGSEDLLQKLIDPTTPTSLNKLGSLTFSGGLTFERLNLSYYKNIHHNLFIGISTSIQNLTITDIMMKVQLNTALTADQQKGLDVLRSKIPDSINSAGMYTTALSFGYNKMFENIAGLEYLHFFIKGNIATPQSLSGSHHISLLQYPIAGNIAFSYPIITILELGVTKHIAFGIFNLIVPFQKRTLFASINNSTTHNNILLTNSTNIEIQPRPVFSGTWYIQAHDIKKNLNVLCGYGMTYGMKWNIKPINPTNINTELINQDEILNAWYIASMFVQLDYTFRSEIKPNAPFLSLFYTFPIAGKYIPKVNTFGGFYCLAFTYPF